MGYYASNMEALKKRYPAYAERIDLTIIDESKVRLIQGTEGDPEIEYNEGRQPIYIKSFSNLKKWDADAVELLGKIGDTGAVLLFGFGFGQVASAFIRKMTPKHSLIVYEATPVLLKVVLGVYDYRVLFESENVHLIVGDDTGDFSFVFQHHRDIINQRLWIVRQDAAVKANVEAYVKFYKRLQAEKIRTDTQVTTIIQISRVFNETCMANVPKIMSMPGVNLLREKFSGRPAIVVSAGPSLEKNLHLLKKAKNRAIILAVDATLQTLIPAGILPDIVVGIDPFNDNVGMFQDNPFLRDIPFVIISQYTPIVMGFYPGPIFVCDLSGNHIYSWLQPYWDEKGYVPYFGGSVSHLALALAEYLGSDAIALVGQDLSYTDKFHAGDVTKLLAEALNEEVRELGKQYTEKDIFGDERYTTPVFLGFRTAFESKIKDMAAMVINATEGGLPIEGTRNMRLADFLDRYCNVPEADLFTIINGLGHERVRYDLEGLLLEVEAKREKLDKVRQNSADIIACLNRIKALKEKKQVKSPETEHLLKRMGILERKIDDPVVDLVASYRYRMDIYTKPLDAEEDDFDVIEEPLTYYRELASAIETFIQKLGVLIGSLRHEQKVQGIMDDADLPDFEKYQKCAVIYKKAGEVRKAAFLYEKAATELSALLGPETFNRYWPVAKDVYTSLAELYLAQSRLYEARDILEVLSGFTKEGEPDSFLISQLTDRCRQRIGIWEERVVRMNDLVRKAEKSYGSTLDTGHFYFRVGDYEMAAESYRRAIGETDLAWPEDEAMSESMKNARCLLMVSICYSLAHTCFTMDKRAESLEALDRASSYMRMITDRRLVPQFDELDSLLAGLYGRLGGNDR